MSSAFLAREITPRSRLAAWFVGVHPTARVRTLLERERAITSHDALTGLRNRCAFFKAGKAEANRSRRYGYPPPTR